MQRAKHRSSSRLAPGASRTFAAAGLRLAMLWLLSDGLRAAAAVAVKADDFLNSVGVCSAVSRRGENLRSTVEVAKYLGLRWVRAGYEGGIPLADLIALHQQTGIRFSYGLMSGGADIQRLLEGGANSPPPARWLPWKGTTSRTTGASPMKASGAGARTHGCRWRNCNGTYIARYRATPS